MLVDSHCHLNLLNLSEKGVHQFIDNALEKGVKHMLCVSVDKKTLPELIALVEGFSCLSASVGIHPNDAKGEGMLREDELIKWGEHPKVIAVGETGLDYYRTEGDISFQKDAFITHITVAKKLKKPLIIHTREAKEDTISLMRSQKANEISGVMHCFTEDWDFAKKCLDEGFYLSFSGILTFKNAHDIREVAKKVPKDRFLLETDSPYLAPAPYRGKQNEPAYLKIIAEFMADLRQDTYENIARLSTENFFRLFNVDKNK